MKIHRTSSNLAAFAVLVCSVLLFGSAGHWGSARAADNPAEPASETPPETLLNVREYRVRGSKLLGPDEIGAAVYPYLGPYRSVKDIDEARAALEKAYKDKGYQTVVVDVPEQSGRGGIIFLEVVENQVGRLRVRGSRYFSPATSNATPLRSPKAASPILTRSPKTSLDSTKWLTAA